MTKELVRIDISITAGAKGRVIAVSPPMVQSVEEFKNLAERAAAQKGYDEFVATLPKVMTGDDLKRDVLAFPRGTCRICGGELVAYSRSYCKTHKKEMLKKWREHRKESK